MLMDGKMPEKVTKDEMILIYRLGDKELLKQAFDEWLKQGLTAADFQSFLEQANRLEGSTPFIEHIAVAVWDAKNPAIQAIRENLIKMILDHAKWDKNSYRDFIKKKNHPELTAFLTKSSGILAKLLTLFKK
jgi:hypothetical protein